jgi:O-antigen/teichoic acid export membrane protein
MKVKQILINSIWFGVIPKISTLINVLLLPILTPYLTPYDYGIWGVISSYSSIVLAVCTLGLHMHLTNSYFEYKNKFNIVWGRILFLLLISSVLFSIILTIVLLSVLHEIDLYKRIIVAILASFPVLFNSNGLLASHLFTLRSQPRPLVFRNLISSVSGLLALFISVYYFNLGYLGFVLSVSTSAFVSFVIFINPIWVKEKIIPRLDKKRDNLKEQLIVAFPVIPHALGFVLLSSSSRIIMSWYKIPMEEIGFFSNGYMMGDYITIITVAVVTALSPKMQELYRDKKLLEFRNIYYFSQGIAIFAIVLFSVWLPEIYKYLIRNQELQQSSLIARYICFANAVLPLYLFMSTIAFIEKRTKQLLWLVFVPGILNIVLTILLIPIWGYKVAVITTMVSYWSLLCIPIFIKYHNTRTKAWLGDLSKLGLLFVVLIASFYVSLIVSDLVFQYKLLFTFLSGILMAVFLYKFSNLKQTL